MKCLLIDHHNAFFPCLLEKISAFEKEFRKINILFEAIFFTIKKNLSGSEKLWSHMTSTDSGEYHNSDCAEALPPPAINIPHRYLHEAILWLWPVRLGTWGRSSLVSSSSCGDWLGNGGAQKLVFDLTSFRLRDDASSLLAAPPESSVQEICGLYCTQEQNTSLSFYQRGAACSHKAEI